MFSKMYGYSVWIVPLNRMSLERTHNFGHIPHVTLSTNHHRMPDPDNLGKLYYVDNFGPYEKLKQQYAFDPLYALGWNCNVHGVNCEHQLYVSHKYSFYAFKGSHETLAPPRKFIGEVVVADTRSPRWSEWHIVKEKIPRP